MARDDTGPKSCASVTGQEACHFGRVPQALHAIRRRPYSALEATDAVVSGRFRVTVEGREVVLEAADCLAVPRGTPLSAEW
jgi:hypothetical protein